MREAVEGLGEVVRRRLDHAEVRDGPLGRRGGQVERAEHVRVLGVGHVLVEDELVHRAHVVRVDLVEQVARVDLGLAQLLRAQAARDDAADLLRVELRDLVRGHAVDVQVVADERLRGLAALVRARDALGVQQALAKQVAQIPEIDAFEVAFLERSC